jgi:hypothetical protein
MSIFKVVRPKDIRTLDELSQKNVSIYGDEKMLRIVSGYGLVTYQLLEYFERFVAMSTTVIRDHKVFF